MAIETLSATYEGFYAPRFEVEIKGTKLPMDVSKSIVDVSVDEKEDQGSTFRMTVNDEFDMATQKFRWLDNPLFKVNNQVTIRMGYGSAMSLMAMGKITGIEPSFFTGETPTISVSGQDLSYDFMKTPSPERTFENLTYSDIARKVATEAGMLAVIDDTTRVEPVIHKDSHTSYYRLLGELAKRAGGYQFFIEGRTMYFAMPGDNKKEILALALKKDLISFKPSLKTTGLVTEVEVRGHDPSNPSRPIIGTATSGSERPQEPRKQTGSRVVDGTRKKVITSVVVRSVDEANKMAKAALDRASNTLIQGDGECIGIPTLRAGTSIMLEKVGMTFSGKYYVTGTTHTINASGYRTKFSVKRNAI